MIAKDKKQLFIYIHIYGLSILSENHLNRLKTGLKKTKTKFGINKNLKYKNQLEFV